jgi:peroxiredoxin
LQKIKLKNMTISIGQQAPSFNLFDSDKNNVNSKSFVGHPVIILFFPFSFSSVCTAELCSMRDNLEIYNKANAIVLGISVDSLYTLHQFKKDQQINFTLLSDFNKTVSRDFGVLYDIFPAFEMQGVSKRAAFIIDKNGLIQYAEVCASPGDLPDFAAIQSKLGTL